MSFFFFFTIIIIPVPGIVSIEEKHVFMSYNASAENTESALVSKNVSGSPVFRSDCK